MLRWIPPALWLAGSIGFVTWSVLHTFHVGQLVLPRSQAAALAVTIVVVLGLVLCWLWMLHRAASRLVGARSSASIFDRRAIRYPLLALLLLAPLLYAYGRYVEPRWVAVRTVRLGAPRPVSGTVRVTMISDLHVDADREPFTSLAERVNATNPDLIVLLGDMLNRPAGLPVLHRELRQMRARHGKVAVRGNWEVWYWHSLPLLQGTGFRWLRAGRLTKIIRGQTVHLVGLDFSSQPRGALAERMLRQARGAGWRVLLHHTPDLAEQVPSADLYLAGHTHGGQVSIPLFGALVTLSRFGKRFERGLHRVGATRLYVSPGVGVEPLVPLRIGVRPEVTVFELGPRASIGQK